ncbi:hypothetical protein GQ457_18G013570 [Hibiscus cannabinus]
MPWNPDHCDILDVELSSQVYDTECCLTIPKIGRKCSKRVDSIWGAWFFFSFYFKPAMIDKSKAKVARNARGVVSGFHKSKVQRSTILREKKQSSIVVVKHTLNK